MIARKYITKSRSGHYTATVRVPGHEALWTVRKISTLREANRLADAYLATQGETNDR